MFMEAIVDFRVNIRIKRVYRQCQDMLNGIIMIMYSSIYSQDHNIILARHCQQTIEI